MQSVEEGSQKALVIIKLNLKNQSSACHLSPAVFVVRVFKPEGPTKHCIDVAQRLMTRLSDRERAVLAGN